MLFSVDMYKLIFSVPLSHSWRRLRTWSCCHCFVLLVRGSFDSESRHKIMCRFSGPSKQSWVYLNCSLFFFQWILLNIHESTMFTNVSKYSLFSLGIFRLISLLEITFRSVLFISAENTAWVTYRIYLKIDSIFLLSLINVCWIVHPAVQNKGGLEMQTCSVPFKICFVLFIVFHDSITEMLSNKIPISNLVDFMEVVLSISFVYQNFNLGWAEKNSISYSWRENSSSI